MSMISGTDHEVVDRLMGKLYPILGGHIYFQTLSAAVQLDLFSLLKQRGPLPLAEIANCLGIEPKPARILLLGCTTLGLLNKSGSMYANSEVADRLLVRDAPGNMVAVIQWQHFINYRAMYWFYDALKKNKNVGLNEFVGDEPTLYQRLAHDPKLEQIFQDAMEGISVQANAMLAQFVDFSRVRHLVDVGGGNGTNIIALARKYPHLRATVFDSPTVCRIAEENIRAAGLSARLGAVPGDCFEDEFPKDADCLLFGHFFTIWSEEENMAILKKCYKSLPAGGSVVIFNMMQSDNEDGPMSAALGSPYFLTIATGSGMLYTWNEYETWMRQAGFAEVLRQSLPRDHGAIIGKKH
jgi:predicted O-methyltransferase YrrM